MQLPMQETRIWFLVQEDPTCHEATKPVCHDYWTCAMEPVLCNKRSHCDEKPMHCNRESMCTATKTQHTPPKKADIQWYIRVFVNELPLMPWFNVLNSTWEVPNERDIFIGSRISRAYQWTRKNCVHFVVTTLLIGRRGIWILPSSVHKITLWHCNY